MEESRIALPIGTALDRYIKSNQDFHPNATGAFSQLLRDIALSGKVVNREVNKAGLMNIGGAIGTQNEAGDDQQHLDVLANIRFSRALKKGGEVCAIVSEEEKDVQLSLENDVEKVSKGYVGCFLCVHGCHLKDRNWSIGVLE